MIRTFTVVERNVFDAKLPPIVLVAGVRQDVLPDVTKFPGSETVYRELFNSGVNPAFYAFGRDCDNITNYNAYLAPGQMLEVATLERVSMMSIAGTTISRTSLERHDLEVPSKNIL